MHIIAARPGPHQALSVSAPSIKAHFLENSYPSPGGYTGRPYSAKEKSKTPPSRTQCPDLPGATPRAGGVRPLCAEEGPRNVPSECAGVGAPINVSHASDLPPAYFPRRCRDPCRDAHPCNLQRAGEGCGQCLASSACPRWATRLPQSARSVARAGTPSSRRRDMSVLIFPSVPSSVVMVRVRQCTPSPIMMCFCDNSICISRVPPYKPFTPAVTEPLPCGK